MLVQPLGRGDLAGHRPSRHDDDGHARAGEAPHYLDHRRVRIVLPHSRLVVERASRAIERQGPIDVDHPRLRQAPVGRVLGRGDLLDRIQLRSALEALGRLADEPLPNLLPLGAGLVPLDALLHGCVRVEHRELRTLLGGNSLPRLEVLEAQVQVVHHDVLAGAQQLAHHASLEVGDDTLLSAGENSTLVVQGVPQGVTTDAGAALGVLSHPSPRGDGLP